MDITDYCIVKNDDENTICIKTKEQELMDLAKANNMLIVFDRNTKKFYIGSEEIEVKDKVIFHRSFISTEEEPFKSIRKKWCTKYSIERRFEKNYKLATKDSTRT